MFVVRRWNAVQICLMAVIRKGKRKMSDKTDTDKEEKNDKKQNFILRFLNWLAKGTENDSKSSPFCST